MLLLKVRPPLHPDDLHARLRDGLHYYAHHKPHQGIKGATPAEMFFGKNPACINAVRPHRAYENKSEDKLFEISYLDPERLLPVLIPQGGLVVRAPTRALLPAIQRSLFALRPVERRTRLRRNHVHGPTHRRRPQKLS
jgi:hypothetical protein